MKIGILTIYKSLSEPYFSVNTIADQLKMFLDSQLEVKIIVSENCPDNQRKGIFLDKRIEWVKITNKLKENQIKLYDYSNPDMELHTTFFEEAEVIANDLIEKLADIDICIMYDIHIEGIFLLYNIAIRKAQEKLPGIKIIAMTPSNPLNRVPKLKWPFSARYTSMPNTIYTCPTLADISPLAKQYDIPEGNCKVVNNSIDILQNMSIDVKKVSKHIDLISPDILIVYPAKLIMEKKFEKIAALGGSIFSATEKTVKIIFCDIPSLEVDAEVYKNVIKKVGYIHGLEENDILFTSDLGYCDGFPKIGILELFSLSNLYICPSYSETFGDSVLEAASKGNFVVLNEAVSALEELGKNIHAYFMRWDAQNFGHDTKEKYNPSELAYLQHHAHRIVDLMRDNTVIYAKTLTRQRYSPEWIFKNQIEPLLS
jgi:hypothetical protein